MMSDTRVDSSAPHLILDIGGTLLQRAQPGPKTRALSWLLDARRHLDLPAARVSVARAVLTSCTPDAAANLLTQEYALSTAERLELHRVLSADEGPAEILPGVIELLAAASQLGWQITYATNAAAWAAPLPERLEAFCGQIISSSGTGYLKHDGEFWKSLAQQTQCRRELSFVVGNSDAADVSPARAFGFAAHLVDPAAGDLISLTTALIQAGSPPVEASGLAAGTVVKWGGYNVVETPNLTRLVDRATRVKVDLLHSGKAHRATLIRRRQRPPALFIPETSEQDFVFAWVLELDDPRWRSLPPELQLALRTAGIEPADLAPELRRHIAAMVSEAKDPLIRSHRIADIISSLRSGERT